MLRVSPLVLCLLLSGCSKESADPRRIDIEHPGSVLQRSSEPLDTNAGPTAPFAPVPWDRYLYVDRTDTIYNNFRSRDILSSYLKRFAFNGVYFFNTSTVLSTSANFLSFAEFLQQLDDSGVVYKGICSGSARKFLSSGDVCRFNSYQNIPARKINRANLELEWWNGDCSYKEWTAINKQIAAGPIADNDLYIGWYENMGVMTDTVAAMQQIQYSDRILVHCYRYGIPTYSYINNQTENATAGRLEILARGARMAGKRAEVVLILSAADVSCGASATYSGKALREAINEKNPFLFVEQQTYDNVMESMTPFQKKWIGIRGFIWFEKKYCYCEIPPL